jgi:hypothetical protein
MRSIYGFRVEVLHDHYEDDGISVVLTYAEKTVLRFTAAIEGVPYTIRAGVCSCGIPPSLICHHIRSANEALQALKNVGVDPTTLHEIRVMSFEGIDSDPGTEKDGSAK